MKIWFRCDTFNPCSDFYVIFFLYVLGLFLPYVIMRFSIFFYNVHNLDQNDNVYSKKYKLFTTRTSRRMIYK